MKLLILLFVTLYLATAEAENAELLQGAHAHNDYLHERPLLDALSHGFQSVEVDVWLVESALLVAHDRDKVMPGKTLQSLYLEPLRARVLANEGGVYAGSDLPFYLLIDLKSKGIPTYQAVDAALKPFREMLTKFTSTSTNRGAVTVIISGNRPREMMAAQAPRWAGYDGRLSDLDGDLNPHFMPWISDNWKLNFAWRGEKVLTKKDQAKLTGIVSKVQAADIKVRFWGIPDEEAAWRLMASHKVDFINTDRLGDLAAILRAARKRLLD